MRIHHIGIITKDIAADKELYASLGYSPCGEVVTDDIQNNRLLFMSNECGEVIELVEAANEKSSVYSLSKGYAHICYEVAEMDAFIDSFKKGRLGLIFTEKLRAPAINNRYIVFAMLKNGTLVEFVEEEGSRPEFENK